MKDEIGYEKGTETFTRWDKLFRCNVPITNEQAREYWDSGKADWSRGAYRRMAEIVMADKTGSGKANDSLRDIGGKKIFNGTE